jgi:hypothetical protein
MLSVHRYSYINIFEHKGFQLLFQHAYKYNMEFISPYIIYSEMQLKEFQILKGVTQCDQNTKPKSPN